MFNKHNNNMFNKHNNNMLNKHNNMFMKIFDTQSYYGLLQTPMQTHPPPPPPPITNPAYTHHIQWRVVSGGGGAKI